MVALLPVVVLCCHGHLRRGRGHCPGCLLFAVTAAFSCLYDFACMFDCLCEIDCIKLFVNLFSCIDLFCFWFCFVLFSISLSVRRWFRLLFFFWFACGFYFCFLLVVISSSCCCCCCCCRRRLPVVGPRHCCFPPGSCWLQAFFMCQTCFLLSPRSLCLIRFI